MSPQPPLRVHHGIHDGPDITVVDLDDCDAGEVARVHRVLAARLMQGDLRVLLVKSGRRAPEAHRALADALRGMLRHRGVPDDLRLALLSQSPQAAAVFADLARQFKGTGLALRVFDEEGEALAWLALQDRADR